MVLALSLAVVTPARAREKNSTMALGYSPLFSLEQGGGIAPFGISLSASTVSRRIGFEGDFAFHRDEGVNIVTAAAGPRWEGGGPAASPFVHVMVLFRHDSFMGFSSNHAGVMGGFGVDLGGRKRARLRLALDAQVIVSGEFYEFLRPTVGAAF